jgi:hypothetical protein
MYIQSIPYNTILAMHGKLIAGEFIAIAGEMRRFPASNENTDIFPWAKSRL